MRKNNLINKDKIREENGAVLVVALMMLCLLTIIVAAASKTTSIETMISGAEKDKKETFYAAEAGVAHIKGLMASLFLNRNNFKIAQGQTPDWDFALNGSEPGISAATGTDAASGATWITGANLGGNAIYDVVVWNNDDGGGATDDTDGIIYIQAIATGLQGGRTVIEVSIQGTITGAGSITDYEAQEGGRLKTFNSGDADPIAAGDFNQQATSL